jgi:glycosyltransferase involved in cell wall biosynthesis
VLVGTRPAINLAMAQLTRPSVVRVAQDHMNLATYKPKLRQSMARWYPRLDAVVTLTAGDAQQYAPLLGGRTRVLDIPNGVPDLGGHRATLDPKVVISAGRLARQKGYDRLLPVWARVAEKRPDWRLEIYGAGPPEIEEPLRRQIEDLGIQGSARLMGRTSELFQRMAESSLYVMTSRREGLPMVLLEAMGVGLPVIAYDCPTGPRDVITDGVDGYVVPNGDEQALEARMLELMDDPDTRVRLATAARRTAADYDVARLAERWEKLFEELAAAKARG